MLVSLAVRTLKPVLSDAAWQWLRHLDPRAAERDRQRARRADALQRQEARQAAKVQRLAAADLSTKSLTHLAKHYGTDKWGRHHYTPHYERHLGPLKDDRFTLLEIGIGGYSRAGAGGASLRMWKTFFPQADIVGLDIEDKSFVDEDRIRTIQGSQVDAVVLESIAAEAGDSLRVVIDDGSHQNEHILETFRILFPLLADGGTYVIEDTQTSYWKHYGGSTDPSDPTTSMNMVKSLLDGLNYEENTPPDHEPTYTELHVVGVHVYHNLVFIDKGLNNEDADKRARARAKAASATTQL